MIDNVLNTINNYEIVKSLGSSNKRKFNEVYLVRDKQTGILGVLKILKKTEYNDFVQTMFRHEKELKFNSKNLPEILLNGEDEISIFLIKKYVEGVTLDLYFKRLSSKEKSDFFYLFLQKINPLFEELASKGLVHGDIRPSNIILSGTGLNFEVSLIDFGLSFYVQNDNSKRKLVFPLAYAAPELILNRLDVANTSTDLYALGIVFYQLLTGELPFKHSNPAVMTNLQLTYPIQIPKVIPKELKSIIEKMCFKFPFPKPPNLLNKQEVTEIVLKSIQERFQTVTECIREFELLKKVKKKSLWDKLIQVFSIS